ncbi:MAG: hypothetical protein JO127_00770 [Caulobacteraceae bacterium]|nr:hypothetical protein [Caulobacteraceae bacterium]
MLLSLRSIDFGAVAFGLERRRARDQGRRSYPPAGAGLAASRPLRLTLPQAEFNQRLGRLPVSSPARRGKGFCRTMSEAEWNLVFPETPSDYGGAVCVRH